MEKYIDQFLDDDLDIEITFNDYGTFFNLLNRRGLIYKLENYEGDNLNYFLIWLFNTDKKEFRRKVVSYLSGDLVIDESGNISLDVNDVEDLSYLFCKNSRISSRETVRSILNGEYDSDLGGYSATDDVYRDVIRNLNPKNYAILRKYIVDSLEGVEISTDEFEFIDDSNVDEAIRDEDTMNSLLDNELYELNSSLYSLYDQAHGSVLIDEYRQDIFRELDDFFSGDGEYIRIPSKYSKSGTQQRFRIPVSTNFDNIIVDYLIDNKDYGDTGKLSYYGSYLDLLESQIECLTVRWTDYPSSSEVDELMNELFTDYI
jgi:hypothetical protein